MQRDLDRVNFVLAAYMRTRLYKIRKHALHLISDQKLMFTRLSRHEHEFCRDIAELVVTHWRGTALGAFPERYKAVAGDKAITAGPDLSRHVFVHLKRAVPDFSLGSGADAAPVPLEEGDTFVMSYNAARQLIETGAAVLL